MTAETIATDFFGVNIGPVKQGGRYNDQLPLVLTIEHHTASWKGEFKGVITGR